MIFNTQIMWYDILGNEAWLWQDVVLALTSFVNVSEPGRSETSWFTGMTRIVQDLVWGGSRQSRWWRSIRPDRSERYKSIVYFLVMKSGRPQVIGYPAVQVFKRMYYMYLKPNMAIIYPYWLRFKDIRMLISQWKIAKYLLEILDELLLSFETVKFDKLLLIKDIENRTFQSLQVIWGMPRWIFVKEII